MITEKITAYMHQHPDWHKSFHIAKALGIPAPSVRRALSQLSKAGTVEFGGTRSNRVWRICEVKRSGVVYAYPVRQEPVRTVVKRIPHQIKTVKEVVQFVGAPYPVEIPGPERIVEKEVIKRVEVPAEVEKLVEKHTGYVFLHRGGEGETTPESLRAQELYFRQFFRAKKRHFDNKRY